MEKEIQLRNNGFFQLLVSIVLMAVPACTLFYREIWIIPIYILISVIGVIWITGLFIVQPNQTKVLLFFGKYCGTVKGNGFFWLNPFYIKKRVSLRIRNLESDVIKVNDQQGNPILISAIVVWKVVDTYKAVFDIETLEEVDPKSGLKKTKYEESYQKFIKIQTESALRKLAHTYPYDNLEQDGDTEVICLRSGIDEINTALASEVKERLSLVGIEVIEARISNLSYAPEIAGAMLRRQQATAIIAARQKIVEGAVGMVKLALDELKDKHIIELDDEKKASMVSNLLVVLCADESARPVVNAGSIY
ncbi:MAG: SPFH domain-containing protein [Prolixibacteraceae bacterium]|jgi:regulator of protease activity HflC (stomatin/prohibitin superfamily)|nr:SPFH domain-containing protein [Prolixibacteraceae bacterium]